MWSMPRMSDTPERSSIFYLFIEQFRVAMPRRQPRAKMSPVPPLQSDRIFIYHLFIEQLKAST